MNPPLELEDSLKFYKFYLYRTPSDKDLKAFWENDLVPNRKHIFSNIGNDKNKSQRYFMNQNMFRKERKMRRSIYSENLLSLGKIRELCQANHIKFSFFIQPFHYKNLLAQDPDVIKNYKKDLLSISDDYLDCSRLTDYTTDNRYWVDVSHYNIHLGNLLLNDIMFKANNYSNLCTNINKENLQEYLMREHTHIYDTLPSLIQSDMKVIPHKGYYPHKVFAKKINLKTQYLQIKLPEITCKNEDLLILINIETFKETDLHIGYEQQNGQAYVSETQLYRYTGWPRVDNHHTVSLIIHCPILKKDGFTIRSDKKIHIQDIQVYQRDTL